MASKTKTKHQGTGVDFTGIAKTIVPVELEREVESSFLPYAYAVIGGRAIPSAEDGLKPVQRRILYSMFESGFTPDRLRVKSSRIVGQVMGLYHPHGDAAIYDALVRLAQDYNYVIPLVDGQGNFGTHPGDGYAAARYTEARLAAESMRLLTEVREDCVVMKSNYDASRLEPALLPAQFPNLVINGAAGIAVGLATKMPTHNPDEVIAATRALLANPDISLDELMKHIPGPDLPTGAQIIGVDGIREAYATGRGVFRIRSVYDIEPLGRGRHRITFTELPYDVQIEKVIDRIKTVIADGKLLGIDDVKDLTDRLSGTRFVVETKAGINPEALVNELFQRTDLEVNFNVNNTVLVAGEPKVLGLKELLQVFLDHRTTTVLRRTRHRLDKRKDRLHLVRGLLKALADIDKVIAIIRGSDDVEEARTGLMKQMGVDQVQADHILALQLRRLTRLDSIELQAEADRLAEEIEALRRILDDPEVLRDTIDSELAEVAKVISRPRRSQIVGVSLEEHQQAVKEARKMLSVEVADEPTTITVLASGRVLRGEKSGRLADPTVADLETTTRSNIVLVTNRGNALRLEALHVSEGKPSDPASLGLSLADGERVVAAAPSDAGDGGVLALGTRLGVVKTVRPEWPKTLDEFTVIGLDDGDEVVAGAWLADQQAELVFVSSDASLLRYGADKVRPQGLSGGGVAGIKLADGQHVVAFAAVPAGEVGSANVVTWAGDNAKVTPLSAYPAKGRATGGVRSMRFLKGTSALAGAFVGVGPVAYAGGRRVALPAVDGRRDGSGVKVETLPQTIGR